MRRLRWCDHEIKTPHIVSSVSLPSTTVLFDPRLQPHAACCCATRSTIMTSALMDGLGFRSVMPGTVDLLHAYRTMKPVVKDQPKTLANPSPLKLGWLGDATRNFLVFRVFSYYLSLEAYVCCSWALPYILGYSPIPQFRRKQAPSSSCRSPIANLSGVCCHIWWIFQTS